MLFSGWYQSNGITLFTLSTTLKTDMGSQNFQLILGPPPWSRWLEQSVRRIPPKKNLFLSKLSLHPHKGRRLMMWSEVDMLLPTWHMNRVFSSSVSSKLARKLTKNTGHTHFTMLLPGTRLYLLYTCLAQLRYLVEEGDSHCTQKSKEQKQLWLMHHFAERISTKSTFCRCKQACCTLYHL